MPNTDNGNIRRLEDRLTRLGEAKKALEIVEMRLKQIERRAPQLETIVQGGFDNLDEAFSKIDAEFQETRRERWPARKGEQ